MSLAFILCLPKSKTCDLFNVSVLGVEGDVGSHFQIEMVFPEPRTKCLDSRVTRPTTYIIDLRLLQPLNFHSVTS